MAKDRTFVEVTIAPCDLERVKDIFLPANWRNTGRDFTHEITNDDGTLSLGEDEVAYGGDYECEEMRRVSIPFVLEHQAGCNYNAGIVAFDGNRIARMTTLDGQIMLGFDETKNDVSETDLARAQEFTRLRAVAYAVIQKRASDFPANVFPENVARLTPPVDPRDRPRGS